MAVGLKVLSFPVPPITKQSLVKFGEGASVKRRIEKAKEKKILKIGSWSYFSGFVGLFENLVPPFVSGKGLQ